MNILPSLQNFCKENNLLLIDNNAYYRILFSAPKNDNPMSIIVLHNKSDETIAICLYDSYNHCRLYEIPMHESSWEQNGLKILSKMINICDIDCKQFNIDIRDCCKIDIIEEIFLILQDKFGNHACLERNDDKSITSITCKLYKDDNSFGDVGINIYYFIENECEFIELNIFDLDDEYNIAQIIFDRTINNEKLIQAVLDKFNVIYNIVRNLNEIEIN